VSSLCAFLASLLRCNNDIDAQRSAVELVCVAISKVPSSFYVSLLRNGVLERLGRLASGKWEECDEKLKEAPQCPQADSSAVSSTDLKSCIANLKQNTSSAEFMSALMALLHYVGRSMDEEEEDQCLEEQLGEEAQEDSGTEDEMPMELMGSSAARLFRMQMGIEDDDDEDEHNASDEEEKRLDEDEEDEDEDDSNVKDNNSDEDKSESKDDEATGTESEAGPTRAKRKREADGSSSQSKADLPDEGAPNVINTCAPFFAQKIGAFEGGLACMQAIGFEPHSQKPAFLVLPEPYALDALRGAKSELEATLATAAGVSGDQSPKKLKAISRLVELSKHAEKLVEKYSASLEEKHGSNNPILQNICALCDTLRDESIPTNGVSAEAKKSLHSLQVLLLSKESMTTHELQASGLVEALLQYLTGSK